jgi:large subunit ribosomal protein L30
MADEKEAKKPAKPKAAGGAAPKQAAPAKTPKAAAKAKAAPEGAETEAPKVKKPKRPKPPRVKLAPAHERFAAMAAILAKPQGQPPKAEGRIKVTQLGSPIGRRDYQLETLKGLGLNRRHRSRILENTPAVQGMIERVRHLVRVEPAS